MKKAHRDQVILMKCARVLGRRSLVSYSQNSLRAHWFLIVVKSMNANVLPVLSVQMPILSGHTPHINHTLCHTIMDFAETL